MTRKVLAGIAQIMKWEFIDTDSGGVLSDNQVERRPWERMDDAKLLQQRMVDDGWVITIVHGEYIVVEARSKHDALMGTYNDQSYVRVGQHEPSAIVELFCRVYDIKEEK